MDRACPTSSTSNQLAKAIAPSSPPSSRSPWPVMEFSAWTLRLVHFAPAAFVRRKLTHRVRSRVL